MTHRDDKHDDQAFEAYLKRNSELSQRYQTDSHEDVPDSLDQKILMQARDAVSSKKVVTHSSWWTKWNKPLALAASLMLAFTVIYKVGYQSIDQLATLDSAPPTEKALLPATQAPAPATITTNAEKPVVVDQPAEAIASKQKEIKPEQAMRVRKTEQGFEPGMTAGVDTKPSITVPAPALAAAPAVEDKTPAKSAKSEVAGTVATPVTTHEAVTVVDSITAEDVGKFPDTNVAESLQRIPGVEMKRDVPIRHKEQDSANPEQVLQHIRDLRKQGKKKQADQAWKQFQKDFPDYAVAENDVARGS